MNSMLLLSELKNYGNIVVSNIIVIFHESLMLEDDILLEDTRGYLPILIGHIYH